MRFRPFGARSDEVLFRAGTGAFALLLILVVVAIGIELYRQSILSIREFGWQFWQTDTWDPVAGQFGARPFIWGTLYSSVLALIISTPIALGIAIFISELAPNRLRKPLVFLTELLAAIPSIVYGLWGIFVLVPFVRQFQVATPDWMRSLPLFSGPPLGVGMLSAALILAIMVIPFSSAVAREVLKSVPQAQREGAFALGATRWEAIRMALFYATDRYCRRHHARFRPRARRDDGGDDGHRQQPADLMVLVRAAVHYGGGARQRVHRGR